MPGLELGRRLFEEVGRPIIERIVPRDSYAAAFIGKGSDVLGFDTERSMDHDWGPRFQVFLDEPVFGEASALLDGELRGRLPAVFHGFEVGFTDPDPDDGGTQMPAHAQDGAVPHKVEITTPGAWLLRHLGVPDVRGLSLLDWLTFPEQRLLEVVSGQVFHDPHRELAGIRESLHEYPRDVWLYRMACQWQRLSQAEAFIGRCSEAGDPLGMRIVAARIIRDAMKLCFLIGRRYAPYDKWLGSAFARLPCAAGLQPLLSAVLDSRSYAEMEPSLVEIYRTLGAMHNSLGVTGPMDSSPRQFFSRPYTVMRADRFANALLRAVQDESVRRIPVRIGGIDQLSDNTDFIESPSEYRKAIGLYRPSQDGAP